MHDATKVLLGATLSSDKDITNEAGDPATFLAGLAVRRADTGALALASAAGQLIGVSLGRSLSDTLKTAVIRAGLGVPLRLKDLGVFATGLITISSYANLVDAGNDTIEVAGVVFTAQSGAAVPGEATFQASSSNALTAASLAAQITAHEEASALVTAVQGSGGDTNKVTITAKVKGVIGNTYTLVYTDEGESTAGATVSGSGALASGADSYSQVEVGAPVTVDNTTGEAASSGTATGATYASEVKDGIDPITGALIKCALIDMPGGL